MDVASLTNLIKSNRLLYTMYVVCRDMRSYIEARRKGTYSQHGEDLFIRDYFSPGYKGCYVDIGCSHPFRISNTFLLYKFGWSGICVDAIPHFGWLYKFWRPRDLFLNIGVGAKKDCLVYYELTPSVLSTFDAESAAEMINSGKANLFKQYKVNITDPNELLEKYFSLRWIDVLSIDVENLDYDILSCLDLDKFSPRLICVEFNSENDRLSLQSLLEAAGYDCSRIIGCNILATKIEANINSL